MYYKRLLDFGALRLGSSLQVAAGPGYEMGI
jgi:hypothetical protein